MIIEVVGKEIEKIKGDFESYLNGLNMVGEISYSQYSELYDEGTKQIQKAYELGKSELEKENAELEKDKDYFSDALDKQIEATLKLQKENAKLNTQLSDVLECFISASSGDDFEMAESAREVMEVLNIRCYRHGEVKSKLTKAKELLTRFVMASVYFNGKETDLVEEAEQFISEVEK